MKLADRVVMIGVLAQALWMVVDGVRCLATGRFAAPVLTQARAATAQGLVVELDDGTLVEYGPWALLPGLFDVHPHTFAPLFVGLGLAGLIALGLYLKQSPTGWYAAFAFSVATLWYLVFGTLVSVIVLVALLLPSTRARFFGSSKAATSSSSGTLR